MRRARLGKHHLGLGLGLLGRLQGLLELDERLLYLLFIFVVVKPKTNSKSESTAKPARHSSYPYQQQSMSDSFMYIYIYIYMLFTLLDLCVSSLRRVHANLLCIVPMLTDDPRRESI